MSSFIQIVNSNLEAFKLVKDPTHLLYLLYTKYGDIKEDYNNLIINQILFNKLTHLNSKFKENCYNNNHNEFFKRIYKKKESIERIPKLYDYYKNYYKYFCRPFFLNFFSASLLHNYYNIKAEIFYKNNYSLSKDKNEAENKKVKNSMSSIDNDTDNKTIFTKRKRYLIDNDIDSNKYSISLTSDIINKDNIGLISKRSENDSFQKVILYFINEYKEMDNKKNINLLENKNNKVINYDNISDNFLKNRFIIIKNKKKINDIKIIKNINHNKKIKNKSYSIKTDDDKKFCNIIQNINGKNNNAITSKLSRNSSKLEIFKKYSNNINKKQKYICEILKNQYLSNNKNIIQNFKSNNLEIKNTNKSINERNKNVSNNKSNKNIFELNKKLIDDNQSTNLLKIESRNNKEKTHKDFISLKSIKDQNNKQINLIKLLKLSNNYKLFNKSKMKTLTLNMKSKEIENNNKSKYNNGVKNEQNKLDIFFQNNYKSKSNKKVSILNKFSPSKINPHYSTNVNINNNNTNLIKYKSESTSPKHNVFIRNKLCTKTKSVTNVKLSPFDSINSDKKNHNKKKLSYNLSYSNNEKEENNVKINMKLFNSEKNHKKRNINLISKNSLFKNYTMGKALMGNNFNNRMLFNGLNNLKSIINISRNKTKNIMNTLHSKPNPHSLSNSKSNKKSNEKKNILRTSSFNTFTINNKNIYINLKMKNNKYKDEMFNSMMKSSKMFGNGSGKSNIKYFEKNNKIFGKKGNFSPVNIKKSFNFNKRLFKIKNNQ